MGSFEMLLFAGILFLACINTLSLVWAFYLDRKLRQKPVPRNYDVHIEGSKVFKEIEVDTVEKEAVDNLHKIINDASEQLRIALSESIQLTATHIKEQIDSAAASQLTQFQQSLADSLQNSTAMAANLEKDLENRRKQLEATMAESINQEYAKRMEAFENRLSDVVSGYILESLGTNANMEGQIETIVASLEVHKEDIRQDVQQ